MSRISKLIGKDAIHSQLGKVQILSALGNSKTKVNIRCVQRAKGWNEITEVYDPIKIFVPNFNIDGAKVGMKFTKTLTRRDEYGHLDECHINELELTTN